MKQWRRVLAPVAAASAAALVCVATPVQAQPSANQVLTDLGYSPGDIQSVLNREFVSHDIPGASDKDLSLTIAFLVSEPPDKLADQIMAGSLVSADPQVTASGEFTGAGTLTDLAGLQITSATAQALSSAQ